MNAEILHQKVAECHASVFAIFPQEADQADQDSNIQSRDSGSAHEQIDNEKEAGSPTRVPLPSEGQPDVEGLEEAADAHEDFHEDWTGGEIEEVSSVQ